MPIDPKIAAKVAREVGLTLSDARAIAAMADSATEARQLAAMFTDGGDSTTTPPALNSSKLEKSLRRAVGADRDPVSFETGLQAAPDTTITED